MSLKTHERLQAAAVRIPTDRPWRSIAKAITWRLVGTLDTFLVSFMIVKFLGPVFGMAPHSNDAAVAATAGYIAATEVITKIAIYSLHERLWARIAWGVSYRNGKRDETYRRTTTKMATWRAVASLDTMLLAWIFTGNLVTAFSIGSFEVATKLALYFMHERIWNRVHFGIR